MTIHPPKTDEAAALVKRALRVGMTVREGHLFPNPSGSGSTLYVRKLESWTPARRSQVLSLLGLGDVPDDHLARLGLLLEEGDE